MTLWLLILAAALIVFLQRASFIVIFSEWPMPPWLMRALKFVPIAVFPAIVAPLFLKTNGAWDLSLFNPGIIAGLAAIAVSWSTRNLIATLVSGMVTLWFLQWLFSFIN